MASTSTNITIYIMATKQGIINQEDKHNELSRASLLIGEKEKQIKRFSKKKKKYTIYTHCGIIETTDPNKWNQYNKENRYGRIK